MLKNPIIKNILQALAVAFFGFILLNFTFLFDFLFQSFILRIIKIFTPVNLEMSYSWFPPLLHISFVIVIGLITWLIFRTKLKTIYKAIFLTVPIAVCLAILGMFLYRWPVILYSLGVLLSLSVLYFFYKTKQPWLYYYAIILVALTLTIFTLFGGEI